jgi:tyrosyl-tRNA synthetase
VFGVTFPLLLKADGKKFGKSEDGAVWLSSERLSPFKFYQYLLQTKDEDVLRLMKMLTFVPLLEIEAYSKSMSSQNYVQNSAQVRLAEEVTRFVHGEVELQKAITATKGLLPGSDTELDIDVLESLVDVVPTAVCLRTDVVGIPLVDLVVKVGLRKSKAEVRRMIDGGGVRINNKKVLDVSTCVRSENLIAGRMLLISMGKKNKFLVQVQS